MKRDHPDEWEALATTELSFWDEGVQELGDRALEFFKVKTTPTFRLDSGGRLVQVTFNNMQRCSWPSGGLEETARVYKSLKLFETLCRSDEFMINTKLKDGDIVIVDNMRVMHGRRGYTFSGDEGRHVEGGYLDWDEIHSKINVLRHKLKTGKQIIGF